MNRECPNCRQLTNSSFSRLVKDSCGHKKCRMCLLYEEEGCKTCNSEHRIQNIGNYDCPTSKKEILIGTHIDSETAVTNDEIVLPLELVINKLSKPKDNHFELVPVNCTNETVSNHEDARFNRKEDIYESSQTTNINSNDISNKIYIPKIEPSDVILNICTHLNDNSTLVEESQISLTKGTTKVKTEFHNKKNSLQNKPLKHPDRSHISVIPGIPEKYKCNICGKIFRNKKGKCYHDACITGIRPYQCTFCDRSFVKRSHFEYHERVHSGYKPFKCNLCEKAFPQQNKLNRHMYSHSKEKQFICPKCNKGYTKRDDLKSHLSVHNSTTTYSCKACEKTFRVLTNLKRHMRTHTSERPHACDLCAKSFKDKSLLIRHKRTHGKDKPFSCAHCNRVFLSKSELRRHLSVHSDEKPFSCEYCETVFRRKDNLNRHIRHHHIEDSPFEANKSQNTGQDTSTKLVKTKKINPKQKPKKAQKITSNSLPKSPPKVSVVYVNSSNQIKSRLDSMGNITPVIRTTSEVSNAVPVINGPISIRKPEDKTDTRKKTFTYVEPIPLAEAVVINRRIEEKLYSQNVSNHNYFFRNSLNYTNKSSLSSQASRTSYSIRNSTNRTVFYENSTETSSQSNFTCQSGESSESTKESGIEKEICVKESTEIKNKTNDKNLSSSSDSKCMEQATHDSESHQIETNCNTNFSTSIKQQQTNYVPTIKKHIIQQFKLGNAQEISSINNPVKTMNNPSLPEKAKCLAEKKQSNVHWRRRTAETLKPSSQ